MAQQVKLKVQRRTVVGRNAIKKIKAQGLVPGVIYGSQAEPIALQVEARALTNVLAHALSEHVLVELEIADGNQSTNRLALIQEVQHHPLRPELLHVDFHAVSATEKITSEVPIEAVGDALASEPSVDCSNILCARWKSNVSHKTCRKSFGSMSAT